MFGFWLGGCSVGQSMIAIVSGSDSQAYGSCWGYDLQSPRFACTEICLPTELVWKIVFLDVVFFSSSAPLFLVKWKLGLPSGKLTCLWKITIFNGKSHYKWQFSIAILVYQRVKPIPPCAFFLLSFRIFSPAGMSLLNRVNQIPCMGPFTVSTPKKQSWSCNNNSPKQPPKLTIWIFNHLRPTNSWHPLYNDPRTQGENWAAVFRPGPCTWRRGL